MEVLWGSEGPVSVRDVHETLNDDLAYTTVMTVLDRLAKKGLVTRKRKGKAWVYRAPRTREQLVAGDIIVAIRHPKIDPDSLAVAIADVLSSAEKSLLRSHLEP